MLWGARPLTPTNAVGLASRQGFPHQKRPSGNRKPLDVSASHTCRDRGKRGQGFLVFPTGVIGEGNPCPYVFFSFPQIRTMSYRQRKRRKWRSALFGGPTPESPRGPSQ